MNNPNQIFMQYSNGYGHLVVTCVVIAAMTVLLAIKAIDVTVFVTVCSPVIAFWFLTGSANRFNTQNPTAVKENTPNAPVS